MNALNAPFGLTAESGDRTLTLKSGDHFFLHPSGNDRHYGENLTARQIDLLRIGMAVHATDSWSRRRSKPYNGQRRLTLTVETVEPTFWNRSETLDRLTRCVDFLSGGDRWAFRFVRSTHARHNPQPDLVRGFGKSPLVALYCGGLDSVAGFATRFAEDRCRPTIPVTVRCQTHRHRLVERQLTALQRTERDQKIRVFPFEAVAFIRNQKVKADHPSVTRFCEYTHRCRPILFMTTAGVVAKTVAASEVEVYESGVGAVNLPLQSIPADYRTTRSAHPHYLRLASELISHVNDADVRFVLPFAARTKAEVVGRAQALGFADAARMSISCIRPHYARRGALQCGRCTACIFRRQAMIAADIDEGADDYSDDLFAPTCRATDAELRPIRAFVRQVGRFVELARARFPITAHACLHETKAVTDDSVLAAQIAVHRRYCAEWKRIIEAARRLGLPWTFAAPSDACVGRGTR